MPTDHIILMKKLLFLFFTVLFACSSHKNRLEIVPTAYFINDATQKAAADSVKTTHPSADIPLLTKGVRHASSLWRKEDGTPEDFISFVRTNYISDPSNRKAIFNKISFYFESLYGNFNEITLDLRKILDISTGEIDEMDRMFGNYSVLSHLQDDFYTNRIAFVIALNFPYFTLAEKEELGPGWSREEWAMGRLGDIFVSRVPAELSQALSSATGNGEMYIAEYNIHMGHLRSDDNRQLFPDDMILLSHWKLRDELKANYADGQIIEFQIEDYIKDKKFADEVDMFYKQGKLTPQQWMTGATGTKITVQPIINALKKALNE